MPRVLSFFLKLVVSMLGVVPSQADVSITTTSSKGWSKSESFNNLGLTTSSNLSGPGVPAASLAPDWRADGSLSGVTFTAGGDTHSATFNPNGTLATLTAPGKGNILGGHSISGGQETLTADGVTTVTKLDGTQSTTSGSDVSNKTETLATSGSGFKSTTTPTAGAATEVVLNAAGAPTAKNYAAGAGEARDYYTGGLLKEITLARGGKLTFGYSPDGAKDLISATWPAVASASFSIPAATQGYGYDRAGRIDEIGDASGARSLIYQKGRHKQTVWNSGALAGYKMVKGLDTSGRETGFELWRGNVMIHSAVKVPNEVSGEVSSVTASGFNAILGRNGARNLESVTRGSVIQNWPRGGAGRILSASNNVSGAPSFNYKGTANDEATAFDAKGRRLKCATAGGEWVYQYTNGRLSSAVHPTLGNFNYQFDGIGRRTDKGSANTSDLLNRTLAWTNSQNKTVKVNAHPAAQVWFNGTQIPNFTGSYNHPVPSPGAAGGWFAWNTLAVLPGQGDAGANPDAKAQQSGAVWVPPVNESFTFDAAGNRESSALWDYGWDAKNQLVRSRTKNHNSAVQGYDINNAYDAERRRFSKKVNRYQNGSVVEQKVITFLHDGNDIVYEREQLPSGLMTCERKYVWGPDISGTHGGAGGAGGLLLIRETKGSATIDLYPLYDGSGNVVALADSAGTLHAEYGYSPFGVLIYARGLYAQSCQFRFATKYFDQETGLYNFGRRFYDPITGQFISRDPLGEKESLNLYQYGHGDPINNVDVDGLAAVSINGSLYTTLETLIPILTDSPFDDMDSNSGVGNTVPVAESPLDVINLALAAIEVQANALPSPPMDLHSPHTDLLWAMNATTRQLDAAADSGNFDAATTRMFRQTSQTKSNAAHDWKIFSGTAQGVTFIAQPEAMLFKGAAAGLIGLKVLGRGAEIFGNAGRFGDEPIELGLNARAGVLANIAESQQARAASGFAQASRKWTAMDFYENAGWPAGRIKSHLSGIDLTKPIRVTTLPAGSRFVQYQILGAPVGNYFAPIGTSASQLGIYAGGRVPKIFQTTSDIRVLQSTAGSVVDDWSVPFWRVQTDGGGTQFFAPNPLLFKLIE